MSMSDVFVVCGLLFGFMLAALFGYAIYSEFSTQFHATSPFMDSAMNSVDAEVNKAITAGDIFFPALVIIIGLLGVAAAANVAAHPAYFFVMIFVNIALVIGVELFTDIYNAVAAAPGINASILVWTPVFLNYIPKINIVLMLLIALALYGKNIFRG